MYVGNSLHTRPRMQPAELTHSYGVFVPKAIMKHSEFATAWIGSLNRFPLQIMAADVCASPELNRGIFLQATDTLNLYF